MDIIDDDNNDNAEGLVLTYSANDPDLPESVKESLKLLKQMNISRQRRWQLKMKLLGRCMICGQPAVRIGKCEEHRVISNAFSREYARAKHGATKRYKEGEYD